MNAFKACVALFLFFLAFLLFKDFGHSPASNSVWAFLISGLIGLNLGDIFLMTAFVRMGASRTLLIFSFQPLVMSVFAYVFLGQALGWLRFISLFFMILCVLTLSYEKFRSEGKWDLKGPVYAALAMLLDSLGILLTRYAFDTDPQIHVFEGNFYRCVGAVVGFIFISRIVPLKLVSSWMHLPSKSRWVVTVAAAVGTFVSLSFYLRALREGHLATVTAIAGTGPLMAALIECVWSRRWPSKYLLLALVLFATGFSLLLK